jgi:hypothetical protein
MVTDRVIRLKESGRPPLEGRPPASRDCSETGYSALAATC